jgi:hypothetical protein
MEGRLVGEVGEARSVRDVEKISTGGKDDDSKY